MVQTESHLPKLYDASIVFWAGDQINDMEVATQHITKEFKTVEEKQLNWTEHI